MNFSYCPLYGFLDNSELIYGINHFTPNKNALPPTFLPFLSLAIIIVIVTTIVIVIVIAIIIVIVVTIVIVVIVVIVAVSLNL